MLFDGAPMLGRAIARVLGEAVLAINLARASHHPVSRHLGDDGGGHALNDGNVKSCEQVRFDWFTAQVCKGGEVVDGFSSNPRQKQGMEGNRQGRAKGQPPAERITAVDGDVWEENEREGPPHLGQVGLHLGQVDLRENYREQAKTEKQKEYTG